MKIDQMINNPTIVKYQEHRLVQECMTQEQLDDWLNVREEIRKGQAVEPLKPFKGLTKPREHLLRTASHLSNPLMNLRISIRNQGKSRRI